LPGLRLFRAGFPDLRTVLVNLPSAVKFTAKRRAAIIEVGASRD
jgi:hypothetical protein